MASKIAVVAYLGLLLLKGGGFETVASQTQSSTLISSERDEQAEKKG
jgi:hypothetical protein